MLSSASKYVSINFMEKRLHIITNKYWLNGLRVEPKWERDKLNLNLTTVSTMSKGTMMLITEELKLWQKNKLFSYLNIINRKTTPYGIKGVLRHYHYRYNQKLGQGVVSTRIIPWICYDCTTQSYLSLSSYLSQCPENVETNLCCYLMGNRYMNTFWQSYQ